MISVTTVYTKEFSRITNLQKKKRILYNLLENSDVSGSAYGIQIICETDHEKNIDSIEVISNCKSYVADLLCYLYENAVDLCTWRNILEDMTEETKLQAAI